MANRKELKEAAAALDLGRKLTETEKAALSALGVDDLWALSKEEGGPESWILKDLICAGDQVILSGPPKAYKSFFASHLALALSVANEKFLSWSIPVRRSVLFVSLEMGEMLVAKRVVAQLSKESPSPLAEMEDRCGVPFKVLFELNGKRSINIRNAATFKHLRAVINRLDPEVVIFDSLVRFHDADENSNLEMSAVLHALREVCRRKGNGAGAVGGSYRTSLIIHHSRKATGLNGYSFGADSMRGASSIHSEADLVLLLSPVSDVTVALNYSARKVREPAHLRLMLDVKSLRMIESTEPRENKNERRRRLKLKADAYRIKHIFRVLSKQSELIKLTDVGRILDKDPAYKDPKGQGGKLISSYKAALMDMPEDIVVSHKDRPGGTKVTFGLKEGADWKGYLKKIFPDSK